MSNWTSPAREALEGYLENSRETVATSGADADEVIADLRRHVEEEAATLKLSVITEQDVLRILSRIGSIPPIEPNPPPSSTSRPKFAPVRSFALLLFGIILPLGTLIFELITHLCAGVFFDPIPTWFHVFLVLLVPVVNLFTWINLRERSKEQLRWLWLANGTVVGVTLFYTVLYLPMSPFAVVGILFFGLGMLPLAPLLAVVATFRLHAKLRREIMERVGEIPRGWMWCMSLPAMLLILLALPGPLTRHWINVAGSESPTESTRAVKLLRLFGSEDTLLKQSYGRADRLWLEVFGGSWPDADLAQKVFYRVTGKAYNEVPPPFSKYQRASQNLFDEFEWDDGLGGETVAGQVKGLSISESRMDGICQADEGWAYIEWIQVFKNDHAFSQREARAQIQLPPGGVVSRLTLWVNGEEREAAFAGRGEVREAYQKVAVQQRRDPVLVTTSGPDRILMQCFPIPPKGGTMKIRIGMTIPLGIENTNRVALRLPSFVERNFRMTPSFKHEIWIQSPQPISAGSNKLGWTSATNEKTGIRGSIPETAINTPETVLWFEPVTIAHEVRATDHKQTKPAIIRQTVETVTTPLPGRIALVLDGSESMEKIFPVIAKSLAGLPGSPEVSIWFAQDGVQKIFDSAWQHREPPSASVANLKGFGGHDNITGLLQAWEWAAARTGSVVIWIHGKQPVLLTGIESLKQRLDWRGSDGPTIIDVPIESGPNLITEKLASSTAIHALPRFGNLSQDFDRLFDVWSKRRVEYRFTRTLDSDAGTLELESATASSHLVRLWAYEQIKQLVKNRKISEAEKLANFYQLVTPISGAVVLETKQQFEEAGLTPADPISVPSIPEPSTLALIILGIIAVALRKLIRKPALRRTGKFL